MEHNVRIRILDNTCIYCHSGTDPLKDVVDRAAEEHLQSHSELSQEEAKAAVARKKFFIVELKLENGNMISLQTPVHKVAGSPEGILLLARLNKDHKKFLDSIPTGKSTPENGRSLSETQGSHTIEAGKSDSGEMLSSENPLPPDNLSPKPAFNYDVLSREDLEEATNVFCKTNVLGKSEFGTVFKGRLSNEVMVAVKQFHDERQLKMYHRLAMASSVMTFQHPHIVKTLTVCEEAKCVVSEFCSKGSLEDRMGRSFNQDDTLNWVDILRIISEVSSAVLYLHVTQDVIHGRLKPSNILLNEENIAKVADVGLALASTASGNLSRSSFQSPSKESDIRALGLTILQLLLRVRSENLNNILGSGPSQEVSVEDLSSDLLSRLDVCAGEWNKELAMEAILIALSCIFYPSAPSLEQKICPSLRSISERAAKLSQDPNPLPSEELLWLVELKKEIFEDSTARIKLFDLIKSNLVQEGRSEQAEVVRVQFLYCLKNGANNDELAKVEGKIVPLVAQFKDLWQTFLEGSNDEQEYLKKVTFEYHVARYNKSSTAKCRKTANEKKASRAFVNFKLKRKDGNQIDKWTESVPSCQLILHNNGNQLYLKEAESEESGDSDSESEDISSEVVMPSDSVPLSPDPMNPEPRPPPSQTSNTTVSHSSSSTTSSVSAPWIPDQVSAFEPQVNPHIVDTVEKFRFQPFIDSAYKERLHQKKFAHFIRSLVVRQNRRDIALLHKFVEESSVFYLIMLLEASDAETSLHASFALRKLAEDFPKVRSQIMAEANVKTLLKLLKGEVGQNRDGENSSSLPLPLAPSAITLRENVAKVISLVGSTKKTSQRVVFGGGIDVLFGALSSAESSQATKIHCLEFLESFLAHPGTQLKVAEVGSMGSTLLSLLEVSGEGDDQESEKICDMAIQAVIKLVELPDCRKTLLGGGGIGLLLVPLLVKKMEPRNTMEVRESAAVALHKILPASLELREKFRDNFPQPQLQKLSQNGGEKGKDAVDELKKILESDD